MPARYHAGRVADTTRRACRALSIGERDRAVSVTELGRARADLQVHREIAGEVHDIGPHVPATRGDAAAGRRRAAALERVPRLRERRGEGAVAEVEGRVEVVLGSRADDGELSIDDHPLVALEEVEPGRREAAEALERVAFEHE